VDQPLGFVVGGEEEKGLLIEESFIWIETDSKSLV